MKHKLILTALVLAPFALSAEEAVTPEKSAFTASAELGALYKTGNNKSADILAGFDATYEKDVWKSLLDFDLLVRKSDSANEDSSLETTDQKWQLSLQSNYTLGQEGKNYVYGNGSYKDDRFSGFDRQWSVSAGLGRRWYESKVSTFDADIGPGYKRDVTTATDNALSETKNSLIIQAQALYTRHLNEHVDLRQTFSAKYATESDENSVYSAELSIMTKLIETLQLKFSYKIDHNTDVEESKANTETQTGITLVYSF
jgi:putative salt-induced outer membrane protein YdiY